MIPAARPAHDAELVARVLSQARRDVLAELERIFARRRQTGYGPLYDLLADYPFREGKGLRPAICFASCRAVGGRTEQALLSASAARALPQRVPRPRRHRGRLASSGAGGATLLEEHGVPSRSTWATPRNVLALELLLGNVETLGVRKALLVLREVERMARESVEGQAIELGWIADERFDLERPRLRADGLQEDLLVHRHRAAARRASSAARAPGSGAPLDDELPPLIELGFLAGIAFQIHDDLLNLEGDETLYGKEIERRPVGGQADRHAPALPAHGRARARARALRLLRTSRARKCRTTSRGCWSAMIEAGSLEHGRRARRRVLASGRWRLYEGASVARRRRRRQAIPP